MKRISLAFGVVALAGLGHAQVLNGGFESFDASAADGSGAGYWIYNAGNTGIDNWAVGGTSVDTVSVASLVHSGTYALDLAGTPGPGSVTQTLAVTNGLTYRVYFWARGGGGVNNDLDVSAQGCWVDDARLYVEHRILRSLYV